MLKQIYRFLNPKFQTLFLDYKVNMKPRYGHGKPPHQQLYGLINAQRDEYARLLANTLSYTDQICKIQSSNLEKNPSNPTWNNGFLPGLDIIGIYTILAQFKPQRYIEIGSGNSTKVANKVKKEQNLDTHITTIDPQPRVEIDALSDTVIRLPFENVDFDIVNELEANDVLFIDNSHRILPNSDSMVFYMEVLPRLRPGVIVHIHDVYLPYDYPQFMCDRFYSEQYGLAMYLLANPKKYRTLLPNYFISEDAELAKILQPIWSHTNLLNVEQHGGSYWLQIGD